MGPLGHLGQLFSGKQPFHTKVSGLLFLAILAALLCQFFVLRQLGSLQIRKQAEADSARYFDQARRALGLGLRSVEELATDTALHPALPDALLRKDGDWLRDHFLQVEWRVRPTVLLLVTADGKHHWEDGPVPPEALSDPTTLPCVSTALSGQSSSGFYRLNGRIAAIAAAPVRTNGPHSALVGVLFVARYVDKEMLDMAAEVTGFTLALLSGGTFAASGPKASYLSPQMLSQWRKAENVKALDGPKGGHLSYGPLVDSAGNRVGVLALLRPSPGRALMASLARTITIASVALSVLLAAFVSVRIASMVTKPLKDSAEIALRVAQGDLTARIAPNGTGDVFDVFAQSFNRMAEDLGEALNVLEDQKAEITAQLDTLQTLNEEMTDYSVEIQTLSERLQWQNSQLEVLNTRLHEMANTDGLTGLVNHRTFHERLAENLAISARHGFPLSLVMFDVDHFKQFNDTYGHPAGDQVLKMVADMVKSLAREEDVCARYGGEEFAVILPLTDLAGAIAFAERVRESAHKLWPCDTKLTLSLGVASAGPEIRTPGDLVAKADAALYEAKRSGRDRVCVADSAEEATA